MPINTIRNNKITCNSIGLYYWWTYINMHIAHNQEICIATCHTRCTEKSNTEKEENKTKNNKTERKQNNKTKRKQSNKTKRKQEKTNINGKLSNNK